MAEVTDQAKEKAQEAAGEAKGRVREQVDQRSTEAGEKVSSTAGDLRSVSQQLREQGQEAPAKLAEQAAERTERLGSYLTESDADRILSDVEDYARKQPWAVVAGGLVLGFAASRFLKASSSQRYQQRSSVQRDPATRSLPSQAGYGGGANGGNGGTPHTTPQQGHPAGDGVRTDREIGGPTAPPAPQVPPVGTTTGLG
jgi:gas vesicle protein